MRIATLLLFAVLTGLTPVGCGRRPDTGSEGASLSDRDRLQGVWAIESVDEGDSRAPPLPDKFRGDRFRFEGDRLTIWSGETQRQEPLSFTLDASTNPKGIILVPLDDDGKPIQEETKTEPLKWEWIYKFEGEILVAAFTPGAGPRPTEFKARIHEWGESGVVGVSLIRLTKTNEAFPTKPGPRNSPSRGTTTAPTPKGGTGKK